MRAMVLKEFGSPDNFELRKVDKPRPGPGEILVRLLAAAVNPVDAKLRKDGSWANLHPPVILGYDGAGIIEEAGPGVADLRVGDAVYYTPEIFGNQAGTYAEYNVVRASIAARKPGGLTFEQAAAIPLAGGTAWEAVVRRLKVRPGETVLIHAGAGGVGSFAVQFARASGARILATAGTRNLETLRKLGADVAIDYASEDTAEVALKETGGRGVDAAFDIEGKNLVSRCLPAVRPFGRVACILPPQGDLSPLYPKNITLYGVFLTREAARLEEMRPVFERGAAAPLIDRIIGLEQVADAHQQLDTGHGTGKIVLRIAR